MGVNRFDAEKAVEVILYIAKKAPIPDFYHIGKILYFADKDHLQKYGRFICGDSYVAMKFGPVPSGTYDILKYVKGVGYACPMERAVNSFAVDNYTVRPIRNPDLDLFSESNIECLDIAIENYGPLTFDKLKRKSHDKVFRSVDENDFMQIENIAATLPNRDQIIEHLEDD